MDNKKKNHDTQLAVAIGIGGLIVGAWIGYFAGYNECAKKVHEKVGEDILRVLKGDTK